MENFSFYSPTYFEFGKDAENKTGELVKRFGGSTLAVCGRAGSGVRRMRRESLRTIGIILMFVVIAVVIICFDDIQAMINASMTEQTESLMGQLLR